MLHIAQRSQLVMFHVRVRLIIANAGIVTAITGATLANPRILCIGVSCAIYGFVSSRPYLAKEEAPDH